MGGIARDNLLKVSDRISESLLRRGDASELIVGIDLVIVDLDRSFETLPRRLDFIATLMNQSEVVMRRRIGWVQGRRFEVLFERLARALRAQDAANVAAYEYEAYQQQERRG